MTSANPNQFGAPLDQNQYMEQEEEWEREGLLDPAWEKQQRKVRDPDFQSIVFIIQEHTHFSQAEVGPLPSTVVDYVHMKVSNGSMIVD